MLLLSVGKFLVRLMKSYHPNHLTNQPQSSSFQQTKGRLISSLWSLTISFAIEALMTNLDELQDTVMYLNDDYFLLKVKKKKTSFQIYYSKKKKKVIRYQSPLPPFFLNYLSGSHFTDSLHPNLVMFYDFENSTRTDEDFFFFLDSLKY